MRNKRSCTDTFHHYPVLINIKRRKKISVTTSTSTTTIEALPNEILLKIFSFLDFKDLGYCAQTSHRFRNISQYPSLWETVIEKGEAVPAGFICLALNLGCKKLHLNNSTIAVFKDSDNVMHKLSKDNQLKELSLRNFEDSCDDSTRLMIACRSLEKLSLSSLDFEKFRYVPSIIRNRKTLKSLDLSDCKGLTFKHIRRIFTSCCHLKEVDLSGIRKLSTDSIAFICNHLPKSIEIVDLSDLAVQDEHIKALVKRCTQITELCLCKTLVTTTYWDSLPNSVQKALQCHTLRRFGIKLESEC